MEAALSVNTAAIVADTPIGNTLIEISAFCPCGCSLEASRTLTEVGTSSVDTVPIDTRALLTLVIIYALSASVQSEAHVALTAVAPWGWDAPPVQTQVTEHLAHVGQDADVLCLDDIWSTGSRQRDG